jgi:hypothetical protein
MQAALALAKSTQNSGVPQTTFTLMHISRRWRCRGSNMQAGHRHPVAMTQIYQSLGIKEEQGV